MGNILFGKSQSKELESASTSSEKWSGCSPSKKDDNQPKGKDSGKGGIITKSQKNAKSQMPPASALSGSGILLTSANSSSQQSPASGDDAGAKPGRQKVVEDIIFESRAIATKFNGQEKSGSATFQEGGENFKYHLSCTTPCQAKLLIFIKGSIFHFGVLFENQTFQLEFNDQIVSARGERPYLYMENNPSPNGVTFYLIDSLGKQRRENGKKGFGQLTTWTEKFESQASMKTILDICDQENKKEFTWSRQDMFNKDPAFLNSTHDTHTNCKRFALKVWRAAGLDVPREFMEEHVEWLKENWFDDEGRPVSGAVEQDLISNWQVLYQSEAESIFNTIQSSPMSQVDQNQNDD